MNYLNLRAKLRSEIKKQKIQNAIFHNLPWTDINIKKLGKSEYFYHILNPIFKMEVFTEEDLNYIYQKCDGSPKKLSTIISKIKYALPMVELGLTTNGFCLGTLTDAAFQLLNKINLSVISFKESVYLKYQGVNPNESLLLLKKYSDKTTINIVIVDDNKADILSIVNECLQQGFAVDLMFDLISNDIKLQKEVLALLTDEYGMFDICGLFEQRRNLCR